MLKHPSAAQKILITLQYDYIMQSTNFSIPVSIQMCNFSMNAALFRRLACRPAAFLAVWGGQTEREAPLADFKFHAARVRVCVGLAAALRVLCPANAVSRFLRSALWVWTSMMRRTELFQCFQTFLKKSWNGWD